MGSWRVQSCRELTFELIESCLDEIDFLALLTTTAQFFSPYNESRTCFYEKVQCDTPPKIENGHAVITQNIRKWHAKDIVPYVCNDHYRLSTSQNFAVCAYSGFWSAVPICEKVSFPNERIIIFGSIAAALLLVVSSGVLLYWRHIRTSKGFDHSVRNRPYDAFVSYEAGGTDEELVRNEICKRFDTEYGGQFRLLIHQRDFKPGTLILANIQDAIKDTNCALVLLSQLYIRSRWCQQEFEECMEEVAKDSNYGLIVILMDDIDVLKQETLTPYMKTFLRSRTYLEANDPKLWPKLENILENHKTSDVTSDNYQTTVL